MSKDKFPIYAIVHFIFVIAFFYVVIGMWFDEELSRLADEGLLIDLFIAFSIAKVLHNQEERR